MDWEERNPNKKKRKRKEMATEKNMDVREKRGKERKKYE